MKMIRSAEELTRVLASNLDPPLRDILEGHRDRLAEYADYSLEELASFCIVEPGDQPQALQDVSGVNILKDPPDWEYIDRHGGWYELAFVLSDHGFGWIVLIPDLPSVDGRLLGLCRRHFAGT